MKDKFAHPDETKLVPESWEMEYFTRLWAIKEGLYKIHKSKLHSFKNHYKIASFDEQTAEIQCSVYGVDLKIFLWLVSRRWKIIAWLSFWSNDFLEKEANLLELKYKFLYLH